MASCHAQAQDVPRTTQGSDALARVREHWPVFGERLEERAGSLPGFVCDELQAFITCGDLEAAALLVEHRLSEVPWRQWVLSFEGPMAVRLGYDRALLGRVRQRCCQAGNADASGADQVRAWVA